MDGKLMGREGNGLWRSASCTPCEGVRWRWGDGSVVSTYKMDRLRYLGQIARTYDGKRNPKSRGNR